MTDIDPADAVKLLRKAKKWLWDGVSDFSFPRRKYICNAIIYAATSREEFTAYAAIYWIEGLMGTARCYETWLRRRHPEICAKATQQDFQTARHQWLDWMIAHWEAKR